MEATAAAAAAPVAMDVPAPQPVVLPPESPITVEEYKKLRQLEQLQFPPFIVANAVPVAERQAFAPYTLQDRQVQTELHVRGELPEDLVARVLQRGEGVLPFKFEDPAFQKNMAASTTQLYETIGRILTLPHLVYASGLDVLLLRPNSSNDANCFVPHLVPSKRVIYNYVAILFFMRTLDQSTVQWQQKMAGILQAVNQELSDCYRSFAAVLRADPVMAELLSSMEKGTYKRPPPTDVETVTRLAEHFVGIEWEYLMGCLRVLQAGVMQAIGISMEAAEKYHLFSVLARPNKVELLSPSMRAFQQQEQLEQIKYMADPRKGAHTMLAAIAPVTTAPLSWSGGMNHYLIYLFMEFLLLPNEHELLKPPPGYATPVDTSKNEKTIPAPVKKHH